MKSQPLIADHKIHLRHFNADDTGGLDKKKTKALTKKNRQRLDELQQKLYANSKQSVLLIFQGMDASGKDGSVRGLLKYVNPAGVETSNFKVPSAEEAAHDFLWREHKAVPRYGNLGVFNRSHYEAVLVERVIKKITPRECEQRYRQIVDFERMLVENNVVILKFCLLISREEQAKRFKERLSNPKKYWKFQDSDLTARDSWERYREAYQDAINRTSHPAARWRLIPANHKWYRDHLITAAVVDAMEALNLKWPKPAKNLSKIKVS